MYNSHVSSNIGFGTSAQITPWITYGSEISLLEGVSISFGIISDNETQEISFNVELGTIAGAYAVAAGVAMVPVPGARLVAGTAAVVILLIDIIN